MKIEETEKPFLVIKHCYGNSKRKELKAKENTVSRACNTVVVVDVSNRRVNRLVVRNRVNSRRQCVQWLNAQLKYHIASTVAKNDF